MAFCAAVRQHEPLVLVDGAGQCAQHRSAVNASARAAGLHVGQRLRAAPSAAGAIRGDAVRPQAVDRWRDFLAAVAYRYSSEVSLLPHAIVLEVSRSLGLFGPWPRFEASCAQTSPRWVFVIASRWRPRRMRPCAGRVADGQAVLSRATAASCAAAVPIAKSRLPANAIAALSGMGIRTLGQLLALPRDGLRRRFGTELLHALDRLLGELPAGLDMYRPPDAFDLRIELRHEVENIAALVFPLRRMTDDLAAYLAGRDGGVQRFVLRLEHREGQRDRSAVGLLAPSAMLRMLFELARGRLEQVRTAGAACWRCG